ncbi:thiamine pyrophosphate-dependent dehydrogenase E1 component subunit alpha [Singulisphaera rosea]
MTTSTTAIDGIAPDLAGRYAPEFLLGLYGKMLLIREFEDGVKFLFLEGSMPGTIHQCQGQEATAVGVCSALVPGDFITSTFRGHGHALAQGLTIEELLFELYGASSGCCRGKGGSMHFFDAEKGFLGGHAIGGSHIPLAAGVAHAIQYKGGDQVCLCYFGDGAINQGSFHEALNMAAMWKLPVIYIVENNRYAMGTSLARSSSLLDLTIRGATAFGIPGVSINGNDIELMAKTTREAVNRARAGHGPTFIDAQTYRFKGHSISDPAKYRLKEELDEAHRNDPILVYQSVLKERGWLDDATIERFTEEVKAEIEESIEFAEQSEDPSLDALYEDISSAPFIPQE